MPVNLSPSNSDPRKFKVAAVQAEPCVVSVSVSSVQSHT